MNYKTVLAAFAIIICMAACSLQRESSFVPEKFSTGMSKADVIKRFGQPYKQSQETDKDGVSHEKLYYKEVLLAGHMMSRQLYEVNTIIHIKNGMYERVEQGEERPVYNNEVTVAPK